MPKRRTARSRKRSSRSHSPALPGWTWMLFGLAVGLAVAAAIYVNDRSPTRPGAGSLGAPVSQPAPRAPASTEKAPAAKGDDMDFDFYDMLPKFEMIIPEQDLDARPDTAPAALSAPGPYVLQAGSFSGFNDADRMKAQLALLGIVSRIQKVAVDEKTFHRVRIGPIEDLDELNDIRIRLRDAEIEVMVIRVAE